MTVRFSTGCRRARTRRRDARPCRGDKKPAASRSKYGFSTLNTPAISFTLREHGPSGCPRRTARLERRRGDVAVLRVVRRDRAFLQPLRVARVHGESARRVHRCGGVLEQRVGARAGQRAGPACRPTSSSGSSARRRSSRRRSFHCSSYAAPNVRCFTSSCDCSLKSKSGCVDRAADAELHRADVDHVFAAVAPLLLAPAQRE